MNKKELKPKKFKCKECNAVVLMVQIHTFIDCEMVKEARTDMKKECIKVAEEFEQPNCDCGTENPKSHYSNCVEGNYSDSEAIVRRLKALK